MIIVALHALIFNISESNFSTNHVENWWGHCKRKLKAMVGVSESTLRSHIDEFCWRYQNGRDGPEVFNNIIRDISTRYRVNN